MVSADETDSRIPFVLVQPELGSAMRKIVRL